MRSHALSEPIVAALLLALGCACAPPKPEIRPAQGAALAPAAPTPSTEPAASAGRFDAQLSGYAYPFEVRALELEGGSGPISMAYMEIAPPPEVAPRATVVLLHGKNFSGAYWERTARWLVDQGYRVVMPDQIGFGKSSKPLDFAYSIAQMAIHTKALLDHLGEESRVHLIGHSMGGIIAVRFALLYPDRVDRVVLVNPIGLEDWYAKGVPPRGYAWWLERERAKSAEDVRAYMREAYFDGQWEPAYEELAAIQIGWAESPDKDLLARVSARTYQAIVNEPVVHEFGRIQVPVSLIIGTRDRTAIGKGLVDEPLRSELGRYDRLGRQAAEAIPDARLFEIEGVGHVPQVEAWDRYIAHLEEALRGPKE